MKKFFEMIKNFPKSLKAYWNMPPEGRYMTYKEIGSLAGGFIGVRVIIYCVSQMIISVGNTLIGNTIGISPTNLYIIYIVALIASFPMTAVRANIIDNTRSMKGKYRPYLITMGIPTAVLGTLFVWMPYDNMSQFMKCAVVLAFNIAFQFFYNFYNDAQGSLINVLSPNSIERSDVISIKNVVENISPSILNIIFPIAAKMITGEDTLYDIKIYRYLFPPMLILGFVISLVAYLNTEEKIVQAKSHFIQIKFVDAFRQVARNKYFWIISLGGWLGFLESAFNNIIGWMYSYQHACTPAQYSIIIAISGNASFWPNLFAPVLIRKYGKRNTLVFANVLNIALIAIMYPTVKATGSAAAIWLMLACVFANTFMTALGSCLTPSIDADIRDYQQYVSGERIDGMFSAVGLVGSLISLATSSVLPQIYERAGLNESVALSLGYSGENVYDVLFNKDYFIHISTVLIIASIIGAVMNVVPYFFYDFSETKQKAVVRVLKIRAMFEDYGNGVLKDEDKAAGLGILADAEKTVTEGEITDIEEIAARLKNANGEERDALKAEIKKAKKANEEFEIASFILREISKYDSPLGMMQYEYARRIYDAGAEGFMSLDLPDVKSAKSLKAETAEEKEIRRQKIRYAKELASAKKYAKKYFDGSIVPFDISELEALFDREDAVDIEINDVVKAAKKANEENNKALAASLKNKLDDLHKEKAEVKAKIKTATNANTCYHRAAKPYIDAVRVITQKENYESYDILKNAE